ncbi:MAG: nucleoside monophosphate kinase [Actinomycetota bacterium]
MPVSHDFRSSDAGSTLLRQTQPRIFLVGRPGAGKGTQGVRLAQRLGVQYVSTGDVLRKAIEAQTPLGTAIEKVINAGNLLPAELIISLVDSCIEGDGYVLDGFPRTVAQAVAVTSQASSSPPIALEIAIPSNVALERLTHRGRCDDDITIARRRLVVYESETVPMLNYLQSCGLLHRIDGDAPADSVETSIWQRLSVVLGSSHPAPAVPMPACRNSLSETASLFGVVAAG